MARDTKKNPYEISSAFWKFGVFVMTICLKIKYHYKKKKDVCDGIEPPFIILGNHPSTIDPFTMGCTLYPYKINFLTSKYFFYDKKLYKMLKHVGAIPKTQFAVDIAAMKGILSVLKSNGIIGIFSEGRSSADGSNGIYSKATAGLLKRMKVPVIAMRFDGAYLSKPRWSKHPLAGGYSEVSSKLLFSVEELDSLSEEEITRKIYEYMSYDDYEWNRVKRHRYKKKRLAEGLERQLFRCPKCNSNFTMATDKRRIYCTCCGNEAIMDDYGILNAKDADSVIFDTPVKWNRWQKEWMNSEIEKDDFAINLDISTVKRGIDFGKGFEEVGDGTVTLNREGLDANLVIDGKGYNFFIPINSLGGISIKAGTGEFEITHDNMTMLLLPKEKEKVYMLDIAIQCLAESRGEI